MPSVASVWRHLYALHQVREVDRDHGVGAAGGHEHVRIALGLQQICVVRGEENTPATLGMGVRIPGGPQILCTRGNFS